MNLNISRALLLSLLLCLFNVNSEAKESRTFELEPYNKVNQRIGEVAFFETFNYSFKTSGVVEQLALEVGHTFSKGSLLASVDTQDVSAELNRLLAEKAFVNQEVKRFSRLSKLDAVSASDYEKYKSLSSQLKAGITRAKGYIAASKITAPFDGIVIDKKVRQGEWVGPGQPVFSVAPIQNNYVLETFVSGEELKHLSVGQELELEANLGSVSGQIRTIDATPSNVTNMYRIKVAFDNSLLLPIGSNLMANIPQASQFVFKLPRELVHLDFNQTTLLTLAGDNGKAVTKRFRVLDADHSFVYLDADQLTVLHLAE